MYKCLLRLISILFLANLFSISPAVSQVNTKYYLATLAKYKPKFSNILFTKSVGPFKAAGGERCIYTFTCGTLSAADLAKLKSQKGVLYVEESRPVQMLFTPSDPAAMPITGGQATLLAKLEAYAAWDSAQGDTNITIAVLDQGIDYLHPDLAANVAKNHADPINGVDDDQNGFIDDYYGWDMGNKDNNPRPDPNETHGLQVAGVSSATTNNGIGVAGLAFKCRYLPVKISGARNGNAGYDGIIYAANRGVKVMNLSWGSAGYPAQYEQDIIDYAVNTKGVVVVAAAGNTAGILKFYPASYKGVISVAFTELNDLRNANSTIAQEVAVVAPGNNIFGIKNGTTYDNIGGGSSFASPMVAALAGLVLAKYPSLSPEDVKYRIMATADRIDTLSVNRNAAAYTGAGRINFRRAVSGPIKPYIRVSGVQVAPRAANLAPGLAPLSITLTNTLAATNRLVVQLSLWDTAQRQFVRMQGPDSLVLTGLAKGQEVVIPESAGFALAISSQLKTVVTVAIDTKVDGIAGHQVFALNPGYFMQDLIGPNSQLSLAANLRLGYWDNQNSMGAGFAGQGRRLLGEAGLIIAQDSLDVRNNIYARFIKNDDFKPEAIATTRQDSIQVIEAQATAPDSMGKPLNIKIKLKGYAWPSQANRPGLITEWTLTNQSSRPLDSLKLGVYADWDLNKYWLNQMRWDSVGGFGYAYAYNDTAFAALVPLSPGLRHGLFAIDGVPLAVAGNLDIITGGFSRLEKYRAVSGNRLSSGGQAGTNSVGIHHTRLPRISGGSSARVAYAWIGANSLEGLRTAANNSKIAYKEMRQGRAWPITNTFSNCLGDSLILNLPSGRWALRDSAGVLLKEARGSVTYMPTKLTTLLRVQELDSLFDGPQSVLTINSRNLKDSLPGKLFGQAGISTLLPPSPALLTDSVFYRIEGLTLPYTRTEKNLGATDSLKPLLAGIYRFCRSIKTLEGCATEACDSLVVTAPVATVSNLNRFAQPLPNPTSELLALPSLATEQMLYDNQGRKVFKNTHETGSLLDVSKWPRGLYLWQSGKASVRIVLQ